MAGSIGGGPSHIDYFLTGAGGNVSNQTGFANSIASSAVQAAQEAASAMQAVSLDPIDLPTLSFPELDFAVFDPPDRPVADIDDVSLTNQPVKPPFLNVDLTPIQNLLAPADNLPAEPDVSVPASPTLVTPTHPGSAPVFDPVEMPTFEGEPLPTVPTLEELQIPEAPEIDLDSFDVTRPEFSAPEEHIYENNLIAETEQLATGYLQDYLEFDPDGEAARERWRAMLQGGTGLPAAIEQALFDRAMGREEVSSEQAVKQAQQEWAARGFALPGSTLLAREGEIRRENRRERGRTNREITIQVHAQEIDNLRFAVQQGVALEGQRFAQFAQILDASRAIVSGSYDVFRNLISARVEILNAQLQIYQTDVQVFRERVQIERARLEVFRTQLEAERLRGEINQQRVQVYVAQLQGIQTQVDIFRAQIEGANGLIRAQIGKMELYRERVNAYRTTWEGERIKFDAYGTRVSAEQTKAQVFEAQVRAYAERVNAFRANVEAGSRQVQAQTDYNESQTRRYAAEVEAWRSEVSAKIEKMRADIQAYLGDIQLYSADSAIEEARVRAHGQNAQLAFELVRADVTARIKQVDQQIEQLRLAETLGLESLRNSAQVNSQLAASALSAVNVSASISDSVSRSSSMAGSWSYNESVSGEI